MRATEIARAMVTEFGMSDKMGAINYDGAKRPMFLDIPMPRDRGAFSEETAQQIDEEVKRIMTDAHEQARRVLRDHRQVLDVLSERLLVKEVIEGDELRELIGPAPSKGAGGTLPPQVPVA
jgi:cell division protease FtsH